ncbi:hypothetical protein FKP32DRAFT_458712 [Trametes sanguinea]|nr:hypothetical protein FKP32DRAFT_458712 [Trametes sanguinea]
MIPTCRFHGRPEAILGVNAAYVQPPVSALAARTKRRHRFPIVVVATAASAVSALPMDPISKILPGTAWPNATPGLLLVRVPPGLGYKTYEEGGP